MERVCGEMHSKTEHSESSVEIVVTPASRELASPLDRSTKSTESFNRELSERMTRIAHDATFREVGDRTEFHPETVRRYLSSQSSIPASFVSAFAKAFRVNLDWLMLGEGPVHHSELAAHQLRSAPYEAIASEFGRRLADLDRRLRQSETNSRQSDSLGALGSNGSTSDYPGARENGSGLRS